jgi:hypothetical protein
MVLAQDGLSYLLIPDEDKAVGRSILKNVSRTPCSSCNSGWMNQLEQSASPLLNRVFSAARHGEPATLGPSECSTLSRFAVLVAWTLELSNDFTQMPVIGSTPSMRRELMTSDHPPENTCVWVARFSDEYVRQWQAYATIGPQFPAEGGPVSNVLLTALSFGRVAFFTTTADTLILQPLPDAERWSRLWPSPAPLTALPPHPIDGAALQRVFDAVTRGKKLAVPLVEAPIRR